MAQTPLMTVHDVQEHLLRALSVTATDARSLALVREAILTAIDEVKNERTWSYNWRRWRIKTDASYSTGTVTYDHTGSANERELTLASGTWPTNAARGQVLIDNVEYDVESRVSDSIITLSVNNNPGEDVAAGTAYTWYRWLYSLPVDFHLSDWHIDHNDAWEPAFVAPGELYNARANNQTPQQPSLFSILGDEDYIGALAVGYEPPPDDAYNMAFMYQWRQLPVRTFDYSDGTITVSGTTVTGVSTAFTDDMLGAVLRVFDGTDKPTGLDGPKPYKEQRIITARASATSLTIDSAFSGTYSSATKYRIADAVNIEWGAMRSAVMRCAEYHCAVNLGREDMAFRQQRYMMALQQAKAADSRKAGPLTGSQRGYSRFESGITGDTD